MSIVGRLLNRRSLENPSTPLDDPDDWLYDAFGATPSQSGVRVGRESALTYAPFWRGVNLISRDVAKLGLFVLERVAGGKERATGHPVYPLLRYKPNGEMVAFVFKQTLTAHALIEGNGLAYIDRRGDGSPLQLIPLLPGKAYPVRENGKLLYVVEVRGEWRKLAPENIFHLKGLGFDGLTGYSLIQKAKNSIGGGMAKREFGGRFFRNNARPSVVIEHPAKMSPEAHANLKNSWNELHSGLENAHKAAILEEGATLKPFSHEADKAQLVEAMKFDLLEVANFLNLPPHKLGDTTRQGYNSLEQENQSYLDDALDPWLVAWEEECRDKLLTEEQKRADSHVIEFNRQALLRADMKTRAESYTKATGGHPWMTVNEVRDRENMNAKDGFDDIKPPTNNFGDEDDKKDDDDDQGSKAGRNKPKPKGPSGGGNRQSERVGGTDPTPEDQDASTRTGDEPDGRGCDAEPTEDGREAAGCSAVAKDATRTILINACLRMARRLATHARKVGRDDDWIEEHRDVVSEAMAPAVTAFVVVRGIEVDVDARVGQFIDAFAADVRDASDNLEAVLCTYDERAAEHWVDQLELEQSR